MRLRRVGVDSNAFIYYLNAVEPYASIVRGLLERSHSGDLSVVASSLVVAELLVKPLREGNQTTIQIVETLMYSTPGIRVYPVDNGVAWRAAEIRAQSRRMPLVDAVIEATALEQGCQAIIGNDSQMAGQVPGIPYLLLDSYIRR